MGEYPGGQVTPSLYWDMAYLLVPAGDWVPLVLEEMDTAEVSLERFGIQVVTIRDGTYRETRFVRFAEVAPGPEEVYVAQSIREEQGPVPEGPRFDLEMPRYLFVDTEGFLSLGDGLMERAEALSLLDGFADLVGQSGLADEVPPLKSLLLRMIDSGGQWWVPDVLIDEVETVHKEGEEDNQSARRYPGRVLAVAVLDAVKFFVYEESWPLLACKDLGVWALFKEDIPEELIPAYERFQDELVLLLETVAANDLLPFPNHNAP
ncbi:hypothetical protein IIA16_00565 [bacterium]|nr:hypothetical protein [bacterium]